MSLTVRLQGLPPVADAIHIQNFFPGLKIQYGGVNIIGGCYGEAYVKFTTFRDACYALQRSGSLLMNSCIKVSLEQELQQAPTKIHHRSVGKPGYIRISLQPLNAKFSDVRTFFNDLTVKSVIFLTKNKVRNGQALVKFDKQSHAYKAVKSELSAENENGFSVSSITKSDEKEWIKFGGKIDTSPKESCSPSTSCRKSCDERNVWPCRGFYARLTNVSRSIKARDIKRFLPGVFDDSQITFVYDKNGCRTRDCFVMFVTDDDYTRALGIDKTMLKSRLVRVLPVSKEQVGEFIENQKMQTFKAMNSEEKKIPSISGPKTRYLYLRNFAADVNKRDILNFFSRFALSENDVYLLHDDKGKGLGEALVKFCTEEEAANGEKLNHKNFQGTEVLARCISEEQIKVFGVHDFGFSDVGHNASMDKEDIWACVSMEDDAPDITSDSI